MDFKADELVLLDREVSRQVPWEEPIAIVDGVLTPKAVEAPREPPISILP